MTDEERRRKISSVVEDLQEGGESISYGVRDLLILVAEMIDERIFEAKMDLLDREKERER